MKPWYVHAAIFIWLILLSIYIILGGTIPKENMPLFDRIWSVFLIILNPQALAAIIGSVSDKLKKGENRENAETVPAADSARPDAPGA